MKQALITLNRLTLARVIPDAVKGTPFYLRLRSFALGRDAVHNAIYNAEYYARDVEGPAVESAGPISNSIMSHFRPKSVIDVGCGTGALLIVS